MQNVEKMSGISSLAVSDRPVMFPSNREGKPLGFSSSLPLSLPSSPTLLKNSGGHSGPAAEDCLSDPVLLLLSSSSSLPLEGISKNTSKQLADERKIVDEEDRRREGAVFNPAQGEKATSPSKKVDPSSKPRALGDSSAECHQQIWNGNRKKPVSHNSWSLITIASEEACDSSSGDTSGSRGVRRGSSSAGAEKGRSVISSAKKTMSREEAEGESSKRKQEKRGEKNKKTVGTLQRATAAEHCAGGESDCSTRSCGSFESGAPREEVERGEAKLVVVGGGVRSRGEEEEDECPCVSRTTSSKREEGEGGSSKRKETVAEEEEASRRVLVGEQEETQQQSVRRAPAAGERGDVKKKTTTIVEQDPQHISRPVTKNQFASSSAPSPAAVEKSGVSSSFSRSSSSGVPTSSLSPSCSGVVCQHRQQSQEKRRPQQERQPTKDFKATKSLVDLPPPQSSSVFCLHKDSRRK